MTIFRNVVFVAALAGLCAGIVLAALQFVSTRPLIAQAEVYENSMGEHQHDAAVAAPGAAGQAAAPAPAEEEAWEPADGMERGLLSVVASVVGGIGFALILIPASELAGGIAGWRQGVLWGLAGFAVFVLAPDLGLPPELPAMPAGDLTARQIWWVATVAATAGGLALIVFRGTVTLTLLALALMVAPHIVGAPQPPSYETPIPESLHHQFVVAVTATNLIFWVLLGGMAGLVRPRVWAEEGSLRSSFA